MTLFDIFANLFNVWLNKRQLEFPYLLLCSIYWAVLFWLKYIKNIQPRLLVCSFVGGYLSFPGSSVVKNMPANAGATGDVGSTPGSGRFPWVKKWQPTPVFLPGRFHGLRSLVGYSPWDCKELDMTKWLSTFGFSAWSFTNKAAMNIKKWNKIQPHTGI